MGIENSPQDILKNIIREFGEDIFLDKNRSIGLISDYFAHEIKTKKMFANAIRENLPKKLFDIKKLDEVEKETKVAKIKFYYKDDNGLDENSVNFIVDSFVYAFQQSNSLSQNDEATNNYQLITANLPTKIFTEDDLKIYEKDHRVEIPYGFTEIGEGAFEYSSVSSITIPDGLTRIGDRAFAFSDINFIRIPESVKSIGDLAFDCTHLITIKIPDSVKSIGSHAFRNCSRLIDITLPESITSIGEDVFHSCRKLKAIRCKKVSYAEKYLLENSLGQLIKDIKDDTYPSNTRMENSSTAVLTKVEVENYIKENNINFPFDFIVPEGCLIIDDGAFSNCKLLKSVAIPNSVEFIGENAFYSCSALVNINIPPHVSIIGKAAFAFCYSLTSILIPNGVTELEEMVFAHCSSLRVIVPDSVKIIAEDAFVEGEMEKMMKRLEGIKNDMSELTQITDLMKRQKDLLQYYDKVDNIFDIFDK